MSAKVLDSSNSFSTGVIVVQGAQFMLDPDSNPGTNDFPAVVNNSWTFFLTWSGKRYGMASLYIQL